MDKEIIDKIFGAIENENYEYLCNLVDITQPFVIEYMYQIEKHIFSNIMRKIEKEGDFNYFLTKKYTNIDTFCDLIVYSTNIEEIKACINERIELGLTSLDVKSLILATKDKEYIKQCIQNKDELGFNSYDIINLILATKDKDYIKECIDNKDELGLGFYDIQDLILATEDKEYIKKYVRELIIERDRLSCSIYGSITYDIVTLISATKDTEYIKKFIDNRDEFDFDSYNIVTLISATEDKEYIKSVISKRMEFGLNSYDIIILILATKDREYIKECIDKRDELGLDFVDIKVLELETKDKKYIEKYIKEYMAKTESISLDSGEIVSLILATKDKEYIKECISKQKELGLNCNQIVSLILEINDKEYIKECIVKQKELGLDSSKIVRLISKSKDKQYIKECIDDESLNLDKKTKTKLTLISNPDEIIEQINIKKSNIIDLPTDMTIGIEIESLGTESSFISENGHYFLENWKCINDRSISSNKSNETGIETVSPVLSGSNEDTTKEVVKTATLLKMLGQYANDTCGGHIHIGADYLKSVEAWQNLIELWSNTEMLLYIIGNEKGYIPRTEVIQYAQPISRSIEKALNTDSINLENETDLQQFKDTICEFQEDRYKGINFQNLVPGGKGTIEFRLANGTVNPETWIENINLFGGIVRAAQELANIQCKDINEITKEEKCKLRSFEKIKSEDLSESEKLELLLFLVVNESNRNIYRKRYKINSKLLNEDPQLKEVIKKRTAKHNIRISKNEILKHFLLGEERITGQEMEITEKVNLSKLKENMQLNSKPKNYR